MLYSVCYLIAPTFPSWLGQAETDMSGTILTLNAWALAPFYLTNVAKAIRFF